MKLKENHRRGPAGAGRRLVFAAAGPIRARQDGVASSDGSRKAWRTGTVSKTHTQS